ncbi:MAG: hypothetical protein ACLTER_05050 [Ruminococcus sp.]
MAALSPGILVEFLVGSVLVILGMIFFHGSRIIHDAHGRTCGRQYASHEKVRLYYNYRFYSGLYYHNI